MVGSEQIKAFRALGLGLAAALLAACATTSAPVNMHGRPTAGETLPFYSLDAPPQVVAGAPPLQCVPFARQASGIQIYGDANTWWRQAAGRYPRSNSPAVGSVLVLHGYHDETRGHVAVVRRIISPRVILVDHANWLNQEEVTVNVPVVDVSPENDWTQVRVWYIPLRQWGARTYTADGFIHPFLLQAALG